MFVCQQTSIPDSESNLDQNCVSRCSTEIFSEASWEQVDKQDTEVQAQPLLCVPTTQVSYSFPFQPLPMPLTKEELTVSLPLHLGFREPTSISCKTGTSVSWPFSLHCLCQLS